VTAIARHCGIFISKPKNCIIPAGFKLYQKMLTKVLTCVVKVKCQVDGLEGRLPGITGTCPDFSVLEAGAKGWVIPTHTASGF
jgi:hypothetical protein